MIALLSLIIVQTNENCFLLFQIWLIPIVSNFDSFFIAYEQNRFYFVAKRHINITYVSFLLFAIVATSSCKGTNGLQVKQQPKFKFYVW